MSSKDTEYLDADGKKITVKLNQCPDGEKYKELAQAKNPAQCKALCKREATKQKGECKFYATYKKGGNYPCFWIKALTEEKPEDGCYDWTDYWLFYVDKACSTETEKLVCNGETPICSKNGTTDTCDSTKAQDCTCSKNNVEVKTTRTTKPNTTTTNVEVKTTTKPETTTKPKNTTTTTRPHETKQQRKDRKINKDEKGASTTNNLAYVVLLLLSNPI